METIMPRAEIKPHNGTPTLFLNGTPTFATFHWGQGPGLAGWSRGNYAREFAEAGIHFYSFDVDVGDGGPPWRYALPGRSEPSDWDPLELERRLRHILDVDQEAYFLFRMELEAPRWWCALHPEECEIYEEGRRDQQSFASVLWRQEASNYLRTFMATASQLPFSERVLGYLTGAGVTKEWVKRGAMSNGFTDYSDPMRRAFRAWLRKRYEDNVSALQKAWSEEVDFETAEIPSREEQYTTDFWSFRDPSKSVKVVDYYCCLAETAADVLVGFCRAVKEGTQGECLAGAFYGYIMEIAWPDGFFGGKDLIHGGYQRSGHMALCKVLDSEYVNFLVSPYSYGFRGIGGDGPFMSATESIRLHGKLYISEDDTRTHLPNTRQDYGCAQSLSESVAILKRNFANILTHGSGVWWGEWGEPGCYHDPELLKLLADIKRIGTFALKTDRSLSSEIAVIVDEESFHYLHLASDLPMPLVFRQRHWGLSRMGAPHDIYLHNDFGTGRMKDYKCYVFLNTFYLSDEEREAIKAEIRREGKVAVWIYAPGFINDESLSVDHIEDLTGIRLGLDETEWALNMMISDYTHPITVQLPSSTAFGTDSHVGPIFYVDDPDAAILGTLVYTQGRCNPGMCVKEFGDWVSIYIGAPNVPAPVLRSIAEFAGVHLFSRSDDVLYANKSFVGIHTIRAEDKQICLPRKADVYEVFSRRCVGRGVAEFSDWMDAGTTALYYYGRVPLDL